MGKHAHTHIKRKLNSFADQQSYRPSKRVWAEQHMLYVQYNVYCNVLYMKNKNHHIHLTQFLLVSDFISFSLIED